MSGLPAWMISHGVTATGNAIASGAPEHVVTLVKETDAPAPDAMGVVDVTPDGFRIHAIAPHVSGSARVLIISRPGDDRYRMACQEVEGAPVIFPSMPGAWEEAMDRLMWSSVPGYVRQYA